MASEYPSGDRYWPRPTFMTQAELWKGETRRGKCVGCGYDRDVCKCDEIWPDREPTTSSGDDNPGEFS